MRTGVVARFIAPGVGQYPHEFLNLHYRLVSEAAYHDNGTHVIGLGSQRSAAFLA